MNLIVNPPNPTTDAAVSRIVAKIDALLKELREVYLKGITSRQPENIVESLKNLRELAQLNVVGFNSLDLGKKIRAMFFASLHQTLAIGGVLKRVSSGELSFEVRSLLEKTEIASLGQN